MIVYIIYKKYKGLIELTKIIDQKKVDQIILPCKYMLTDLDSSFGMKWEQKINTCF